MLTTPVLRGLFKNLQAWRSAYEANLVTEVLSFHGEEYCLWDIEVLYAACQVSLPPRMKQAVRLCLFENVKEEDAAVLMGVSPNNPVSSYASTGLDKLIVMIRDGSIPGYQPEGREEVLRGTYAARCS